MYALWLFTSIIGTLGALWVVATAYWRSWRFLGIKNLPPGSMGWPVIGELVEYVTTVRTENHYLFTRKKAKKYGPIFKTSLVTGKTIMVTDVESIKFVLQNEGVLFETGYPISLTNVLGHYAMLFQHGSIHTRIHAMFKRISSSTPLKKHLTHQIEALLKQGMSSWPVGERILLQDEIYKIFHLFLMKQQFGLDPGELSSYILREFDIMRMGMISVALMIPGTPYYKAMKARGRLSKVLKNIITSRRAARVNTRESTLDILDAMMEEIPAEEKDSDQILIDNVLINMANSEAVPAILTVLAVRNLSGNSNAIHQIREENLAIRQGKAPDEGLSWNEYMTLQFTQAVVNETFRLVSFAQGVTRRAIKDVEYKGYIIPKGWTVQPYFLNVHFDEQVYPEPTKFNPWRWLEKTIPSSHVWTFGGGARLCPGQEMARIQIMVFLHHFVTKFKWEVEQDSVINFPIVTTKNHLPAMLHNLD